MAEAKKIKLTEQDMVKGGLLMGASYLVDNPKQVISVSPASDLGLGGGIPEGSWVGLSGPPKCGKTTLSLHIAAKGQREEFGSRPTFLFDVEHRIKELHLLGIKGLKLAKDGDDSSGLRVIRSIRGNIIGAEEFLTAATNIIKSNPGAIVIIDSTSALCSAKELSSDISGQMRSLGPKILAAFCRQMGPVVPVNNCIVISIQHLIANTSGFGASQYEDSGRKVQYQGDVKMRCKSSQAWKDGEVQIGQKTEWTVSWSALGPPGATITNWLRYGVGIDETTELIDLGLDTGLISSAGAWYNFDYLQEVAEKEMAKGDITVISEDSHPVLQLMGDKPPEKAFKKQGREKVYNFLVDNPFIEKMLLEQVRAML
jgi:RecA/RadA recombinase